MKFIKRAGRFLTAITIIITMFAGDLFPANFGVMAESAPAYLSYTYVSQDGELILHVTGHNFANVGSLSMKLSYDSDLLKYKSYNSGSVLGTSLVSVNNSNGELNIAAVNQNGAYFENDILLDLTFDILKPGENVTEIESLITECTDGNLNEINVEKQSTVSVSADNTLSTRYSISVRGSSGLTPYQDGAVTLSFDKNYGIYAGEFEVVYNPQNLDFNGCEFVANAKGMTLNCYDSGDSQNGRINVAFAGTDLYETVGSFIEIHFIPKNSYMAEYVQIQNIKLTASGLEETEFSGSYGGYLYTTGDDSTAYFSVDAPSEVYYYDTFEAVISLENNQGFSALTATLEYDPDVLEYVSGEFKSDVFSGSLKSISGSSKGKIKLAAASADSIEDNGSFAVLKFKPKKKVSEVTDLTLTVDELADSDSNKLKCSYGTAQVKICECDHEWSSKTVKKASCTESGVKTYTCALCGETYSEEIPSSGHSYSTEWTVDKAASCTEEGLKSHHCTVCGEKTDVTAIAKTAHSYDNGKITKAATCTEDGVKTYTCTVCGVTKTETVAKTAHSYKTSTVAPTYEAQGYTEHKCSVCGDSYKDGYTAKKTVPTVKMASFTSSTSAVNIRWNKVTGAKGYRIYLYNSATKKWSTVATVKKGSTLSYKHKGLKAGTEYKYMVRAYLTYNGKTYWSSNSSTLTTATKTVAPKFSKKTAAATSVQLSWKKVSGASGYTVQKYNAAKKMWVTVKNVSSSTLSCKAEGLKKNTSYKFRIRAYKKVGSGKVYSAWSDTVTVKTKK